MPLQLRVLVPGNAKELFNLVVKNKSYLQRWFEWAHQVHSEADSLDFLLKSQQENKLNKSFDLGLWVENRLVGVVGFHQINWNHKHVELGCWISEEQQGKGFVKKALQTLMAYAFLEYKLNRVELLCATHNTRIRLLAEKLGFSYEGTQREGYCLQGRFLDVACYSFLARDFHAAGEETYAQFAGQIRTQ